MFILGTPLHNSLLLDRKTGHRINQVLAMAHDEKQLWLGVDNGMIELGQTRPSPYLY